MGTPAWSTLRLAEFLAAVSSSQTEAGAALEGVERAAEALDAEVAAIVHGGDVVSAIGFPDGAEPVAELEAVAPAGTGGEVTVPGVGRCPATVVLLEHPPAARFVLARSGPDRLSAEEAKVLDGMARVTSVTMRMLRLLDDERAARAEVERLAEEQAALRRVATLVARSVPPAELFSAVAQEVGGLVGADAATLGRLEPGEAVTVVAAVGLRGGDPLPGSRWMIEPPLPVASVVRTGRSARVDDLGGASGGLAELLRQQGIRSAVATPIVVDGSLWGVISVWSRGKTFAADTERRMVAFTELLATAISNAEALTEVRRLADEQAALRRVATQVARESPPAQICAAVTEEVGRVLGVDDTMLSRFEDDGSVTILACWGKLADAIAVGINGPVEDGSILAPLLRTGRPHRVDNDKHAAPPPSGSRRLAARHGPGSPDDGVCSAIAAPIVVHGGLWGAMVATSLQERLPADTEDRLGEFTGLVATAVANVDARSELEASRVRIVQAADEQRRRVVRDLHDGAQSRLVHAVITLKGASARDDLTPGARSLVEEGLTHAESAIDELRELAHGIHPASLGRGGLAAAVMELAGRAPLPVELAIPRERYPAAIESAAYFVAAEALTNVAKYARAPRARIEAVRMPAGLRLVVEDDGVGGAEIAPGRGLAGLADRVDALDGVLAIDSPPGAGTRITAEIPFSTPPARAARARPSQAPRYSPGPSADVR